MKNNRSLLYPLLFSSLCLTPGLAFGADNGIRVGVERIEFSADRGDRTVVFSEVKVGSDTQTLVLNGARGERKYTDDGPEFSGNRLTGTLYSKWGSVFSTKVGVSAASDSPVFANREYFGDVSVKLGGTGLVATAGAKRAEYFGDVVVNSWNAGGTYYFGRGSLMYRYSKYDAPAGTEDGHTASLRIKDAQGDGQTQLWLGWSNPLYAYDWTPEVLSGEVKSATLRRIQPIVGNFSLDVSVGRTWYKQPFAKYEGTRYNVGVQYTW